MKMGKVVMVVAVMVLFNMFYCSAWSGGNKHKSGRNSILPGEAISSWPSLLNPAGSSIVFPLYGNVYPVGFYNVTLNIGQPARPYFLDVDTGSDLTWLQCDAPCTHCSEANHQCEVPNLERLKSSSLLMNVGRDTCNLCLVEWNLSLIFQTPHPLYRPSNDFVPCRDPLCASLQPTEDYNCEHPDQCDYEINYADQYSTFGVLLNDVYLLNFTNGVQLKVRMALGCGYDQVFSPSSYHPLDGLLGLGRGKASLISQLNSQGLVRNVIGHCLSAQGGGYIFFGNAYDSARVTWTPISSVDSKHYSAGPAELVFGGRKTGVGSLTAVFDTGSSYTYFNSHAYQALLSWLKKELSGKPLKVAPDDQTLPLCWHGKRPFTSLREVRKYFKPVALGFTNGGRTKAQFEILPEAYLIISNLGNVCLGILNGSEVGLEELNLIGDISMQDKVMVFENEKQLIGWGPADCSRIPKSGDVSI